jgi:hypothetical protein
MLNVIMSTSGRTPTRPAHPTAMTRALLACGVVAGPLFTLGWVVEGATRADYNPVRHPVSSLALGAYGWTQVANFLVAGILSVAFAVGLWRALRPWGGSTWGPVLIGAYGIGLMGAGVFPTDPVSGYPPGTPDQLVEYSSVPALLHDLFSTPVFVGLPIACFVFVRRFSRWGRRGWAIYSALTGGVFTVGFVLASLAFGQVAGLVEIGGLLQRLTITVGWTWLLLLAVLLLRDRPLRS